MGLGYVWITDGRLVGNVSVYPAPTQMPRTWVIVNVAVYPEYQGRGIATRLMQSTMEMIRLRGGQRAILQVDADNESARHLYLKLGFRQERAWTAWRRNSLISRPAPLSNGPLIVHRATGEWQAEYALAERVRPDELGGIGWLRPLHISQFRQPFWKQLTDWLTLQSTERLVIRSGDETQLHAALWIENGFASPSTHLTLMVDPEYEGVYDEALLNTAVRRFGGSALLLEHPSDRDVTSALLRRYQFSPRREVIHMRWDVH
jgi:ribosomal protein S18 acetylase RimI-like enzyme